MDWVGRTWDWLFARPADAWTATASWVAVLIGLLTVVVAGIYAKRQVDEAKGQVAEARIARLAQEQQAQDALTEQARLAQESLIEQARLAQVTLNHQAAEAQRTRDEQAQPNVVVYMESNAAVWMQIELVVRNFGTTPAYNVRMEFTPELTVRQRPGDDDNKLPFPTVIPTLAPGQEWRTSWDFGPERLKDATLADTFDATVRYEDSRGRALTTNSALDWAPYKKTRRMTVRTVHDLYAVIKKQNETIAAISKTLGHFGTEHRGLWVYGDSAQVEHGYRVAEREEQSRQIDELDAQLFPPPATPPTEGGTAPHSTFPAPSSPAQPEPPAPQDE